MITRKLMYKFSRKLALFQPRERALILITALIISGAIGQGILYLTGIHSHKDTLQNIASINIQIDANENAVSEIIERQNNINFNDLKNQQKQLNIQLLVLREEVQLSADYLIPADKMPGILQNLLEQHNKLELVDFHTLPPLRLESAAEQLPIFQYGLSIKVNGTYSDMTAWLNDIEQLPWVLNWDLLNYTMKEWPTGELLLELHTLSREESWLDI